MSRGPRKPDGYEVGRNRPPKAHQFQPGESGNPKGRPKGARGIAEVLRQAANSPVSTTINGKPRQLRLIEALVLRLKADALKGNLKATDKLLQLWEKYQLFEEQDEPAVARVDRPLPLDTSLMSAFELRLLIVLMSADKNATIEQRDEARGSFLEKHGDRFAYWLYEAELAGPA